MPEKLRPVPDEGPIAALALSQEPLEEPLSAPPKAPLGVLLAWWA
jgi:hypothetical protein